RPPVAGFDLVFAELHEAVPFVEATGGTPLQHFESHRQVERIRLGQQHLQDDRSQPTIVVMRIEVERVAPALALAEAKADAAATLAVDQPQPQAGLVEILAEDATRAPRP